MVSTTLPIVSLHHVGMTVADVPRTLQFWQDFLGVEPRWTRLLDGDYLSDVTGYDGVNLDAAILELPGGLMLEILHYRVDGKKENDMGTANPGNVHLCLRVADIDSIWSAALAAGATSMRAEPATVTTGPNAGARAGYLKDPDGITIELFQPAPDRSAP